MFIMAESGVREATTLRQTKGGFKDPVTDEILFYCELYLMGVINTLVALFGVVSNLINFIIFLKQKGNDCVSLCLISLSVSDFGAMTLNLIYSLSYFVKIKSPSLTLDPNAIQYVMSWASNYCFDISMSTTAFVSVERCLCVVMPFQFKNIFTSRVAIIVLFAIYAFNTGSFLPIFVTHGLRPQYDLLHNKTRIQLWLAPARAAVEEICNYVFHITVATICQFIVLISTQVMVIGLQRSAQFRQAKAAVPYETSNKASTQFSRDKNTSSPNKKQMRNGSLSTKREHGKSAGAKKEGLTTKTKSVCKMVSIVAGIFIACNFWRLALVYARRIEPEIGPTTSLPNTYALIIGIWQIIASINCSVNIFVYYTHRASYKDTFLRTFCSSSLKTNGFESKDAGTPKAQSCSK